MKNEVFLIKNLLCSGKNLSKDFQIKLKNKLKQEILGFRICCYRGFFFNHLIILFLNKTQFSAKLIKFRLLSI